MAWLTVAMAPSFAPLHAFIGGLMLACCVHHMLANLGTVLGVSGFFHRAVRQLVTPADLSENDAISKSSHARQDDRRNGDSVSNAQSIHHAISPEDDAAAQSERTNSAVSSLFVNGLLVGGAMLAAAQVPLQQSLGERIFDVADPGFHLGRGFSHGLLSLDAAKRFVPTAVMGGLVGFGTKLGSGCTSGHFLCGLSRLSPRSIVATVTFFSVAVLIHLVAHPVQAGSGRAIKSEVAHLPSSWTISLLQVPAVFYGLIVPHIVRRLERSYTTEDVKVLHDQAARLTAFALGTHFACGLAVAGMTRPSKVLGFLNLSPARMAAGHWDASLAFVALGGILPAAVTWFTDIKPKVQASKTYGPTHRYGSPLYRLAATSWRLPSRTDIDARLVAGAILFGIGWGLTGYCPGPALVNFGASTLPRPQDRDALVLLARSGTFVGAMGVGGLLAGLL